MEILLKHEELLPADLIAAIAEQRAQIKSDEIKEIDALISQVAFEGTNSVQQQKYEGTRSPEAAHTRTMNGSTLLECARSALPIGCVVTQLWQEACRPLNDYSGHKHKNIVPAIDRILFYKRPEPQGFCQCRPDDIRDLADLQQDIEDLRNEFKEGVEAFRFDDIVVPPPVGR